MKKIIIITGDAASRREREKYLFEFVSQNIHSTHDQGAIFQSIYRKNEPVEGIGTCPITVLANIHCFYLLNSSEMALFFSNFHLLSSITQPNVIAIDEPDEICNITHDFNAIGERRKNLFMVMTLIAFIFHEFLHNSTKHNQNQYLILNLSESGLFARYLLSSRSPYLRYAMEVTRFQTPKENTSFKRN